METVRCATPSSAVLAGKRTSSLLLREYILFGFRVPFGLRHSVFGILFFLTLLLCGCASTRSHPAHWTISATDTDAPAIARAQQTVATLFPADYRSVHRAILTMGRRQFTCDGVLTVSARAKYHLALISPLGLVTDLEADTDGAVNVRKVTAIFREDWSRNHVARDLRCIFMPPGKLETNGRLADGRLVLRGALDRDGLTPQYLFSPDGAQLQEMEWLRAGRCVYHVNIRRHRTVTGHPNPIPSELEVDAGQYHLNLRIAELTVSPDGKVKP